MPSKKALLGLSLALAIAVIAVSSGSLFAAKPPAPIPVTATYRDASTDALKSDNGSAYAASLAGDGSRLTIPGSVGSGHPLGLCYYETTPFVGNDGNGDACLAGNLPDGFSICGGGENVVTPQFKSFLAMSNLETQPGDATTRINGSDNFRYFVRFKPSDTFQPAPNCSTQVNITRIDVTHWEIEGSADDVARVLSSTIHGGPGTNGGGHYLAPFMISVSRP